MSLCTGFGLLKTLIFINMIQVFRIKGQVYACDLSGLSTVAFTGRIIKMLGDGVISVIVNDLADIEQIGISRNNIKIVNI